MILLQKFLIICCKVFLFNSFWQTPAACTVLVFLLLAQAFARPFEDSRLDMVSTISLIAQVLMILLGLLYNVERGTTDFHNTLTVIFFLLFGGVFVYMVKNIHMDFVANAQKASLMTPPSRPAPNLDSDWRRISPRSPRSMVLSSIRSACESSAFLSG
jgi:hypothetical protein